MGIGNSNDGSRFRLFTQTVEGFEDRLHRKGGPLMIFVNNETIAVSCVRNIRIFDFKSMKWKKPIAVISEPFGLARVPPGVLLGVLALAQPPCRKALLVGPKRARLWFLMTWITIIFRLIV